MIGAASAKKCNGVARQRNELICKGEAKRESAVNSDGYEWLREAKHRKE